MDQRTRERLPVLPTLIAWVDAERTRAADRLAAAQHTGHMRCSPPAGTRHADEVIDVVPGECGRCRASLKVKITIMRH